MDESKEGRILPSHDAALEDLPILVVDDEKVVRQTFVECLGEHYDCVGAADSEEALTHLASRQFALAILDVQMPGLSGIELLRKITKDFPETAVIMVSGVGRAQRVVDALRLGAFEYLIKPCDLDVLELAVERALARRALLRTSKSYKVDLERRNKKLERQKAELERLQAQLVHSEKMASLGQLASGVAHELNNPAGFILSNMETLRNYTTALEQLLKFYDTVSLTPDHSIRAAAIKEDIRYEKLMHDLSLLIADCQEGASRLCDIVKNLRTFSRLDEAEFKKVHIHEGIDSTIRLLSRYYSSDHLSLERQYGELPPIDCFAGQLNQVWMNLLVNAAQAIGDREGRVKIETQLQGETVVVSISDTGDGIATENLNRIFDPFFTTKPVGEGTGLGLFTTYSIVKRHGGTISAESHSGKGTIFTVVLPLNVKRETVTTEGKR